MIEVSPEQVLAWRLRRQHVEPPTAASVVEVVGRLCGVQAQVASAAETAVALRQRDPRPDAVQDACAERSLVRTWAMRGTLHAVPAPEVAGYLSLLAAARTWTRPSWSRHFGAEPKEIDQLTEVVAGLLEGRVLSRDELVVELVADPRFRSMEEQLRSGWGALLKPLAWRGALCFGPRRGSTVTFTNPVSLLDGWRGLPGPEEAAPAVVSAYLGAFGPATPELFDAWLSRNSHRKSTLRAWFAELDEQLAEVSVGGEKRWILAEHVDDLAGASPSDTVHLLGAFDQFVLGAGTKDTHMLASEHRARVSRAAGWISPVVVHGGRITGVWETDGDEVVVTPFPGTDPPPGEALRVAAGRVATARGTRSVTVRTA